MFAHGTNHSRGVLILFNNELHFKIKSEYIDTEGRYILVEATNQDLPFLLVNLCAPTKSREQCKFFDDVKSALSAYLFIIALEVFLLKSEAKRV